MISFLLSGAAALSTSNALQGVDSFVQNSDSETVRNVGTEVKNKIEPVLQSTGVMSSPIPSASLPSTAAVMAASAPSTSSVPVTSSQDTTTTTSSPSTQAPASSSSDSKSSDYGKYYTVGGVSCGAIVLIGVGAILYKKKRPAKSEIFQSNRGTMRGSTSSDESDFHVEEFGSSDHLYNPNNETIYESRSTHYRSTLHMSEEELESMEDYTMAPPTMYSEHSAASGMTRFSEISEPMSIYSEVTDAN